MSIMHEGRIEVLYYPLPAYEKREIFLTVWFREDLLMSIKTLGTFPTIR